MVALAGGFEPAQHGRLPRTEAVPLAGDTHPREVGAVFHAIQGRLLGIVDQPVLTLEAIALLARDDQVFPAYDYRTDTVLDFQVTSGRARSEGVDLRLSTA